MSALLLCAMMSLQDDAAKAIETFEATWKKEKGSDARVNAVVELAKTLHDKVCNRLNTLLTSEDKAVKKAAAAGLGTFNQPAELKKSAAKNLASALTAGANSNDTEAKVAILNALAALQEESVAPKVRDHFDDKDTQVATAAVTTAGSLKNKTMVDPLIQVLKEAEDEMKKITSAANPAPTPGKNVKPPPKSSGAGTPVAGNEADKKKRDRASAMLSAAQTALGTLTGASLKTSEEYQQWWTKNKSTFQPK